MSAPLAREIARMPGVAEQLLVEHVADDHGRCRGCNTGTDRPTAPWPCSLHAIAIEARRIATGRPSGAR